MPGALRATFLSLRCLLIVAVFFAAAPAPRAFAQAHATNAPLSNRWLLVVETSKRMAPRAKATAQVVASLVWSGMNGQMRPGDTLGLWTFDESVHAGIFPLQVWSSRNQQVVTEGVFEFLSAQKYENDARLGKALARISRVVTNSDYITVILVSDGSDTIKGTPFDDKINGTYRAWAKEQEKALIPFVTVLRAQRGRITHYAVAMPPWPIEMPPLPAALARIPATPSASFSASAPPPPMALPLIVHGTGNRPAAAPSGGTSATTSPSPTLPINPLPVQARSPAAAGGASSRSAAAAATAAPGGILSRGSFWAVSGVLTLLVFGIAILRLRRARSAPRISLMLHPRDKR